VAAVLIWGPLTQRDGYVITPSSMYAALTQRRAGNRGSTAKDGVSSGTYLRGEYMAAVPPKVGWHQFLRNVIFWSAVVGLKVCVRRVPARG
jgi:hypothetical protein